MSDHDETKGSSCNTDGALYQGSFQGNMLESFFYSVKTKYFLFLVEQPHFFGSGHFDRIASKYDNLLEFYHSCGVNAIKHYIPLAKTDQIIDISGGTGEMIRLLRQEFGIETPGVCVDPNLKMLQIAMKKEGIIPIQATAEEFLTAEPKFPMKFVLMYIKDLAGVFANLARHMPDDGICLLAQFCPPTKCEIQAKDYEDKRVTYEQLNQILKFNKLNHKVSHWKEANEVDKLLWYETLHCRYRSSISHLTDEQIEEGIREIEKKFGDQKILKFEYEIVMNIITKDCDRF